MMTLKMIKLLRLIKLILTLKSVTGPYNMVNMILSISIPYGPYDINHRLAHIYSEFVCCSFRIVELRSMTDHRIN